MANQEDKPTVAPSTITVDSDSKNEEHKKEEPAKTEK